MVGGAGWEEGREGRGRGRWEAGAEEDLRVSEEKHLIEEATYLISCHNKPRGFSLFLNLSGSYAAAVTR